MTRTKPTINTPWNRRQPVGEINSLPSMTIPDQTMSIPEILRRFASGLPLQGNKNPIYDGEDDILEGIDPRTLDISEIHELRENMEAELADIKKPQKRASKSSPGTQLTIPGSTEPDNTP